MWYLRAQGTIEIQQTNPFQWILIYFDKWEEQNDIVACWHVSVVANSATIFTTVQVQYIFRHIKMINPNMFLQSIHQVYDTNCWDYVGLITLAFILQSLITVIIP